jgi:hypothetical protein
MPVKRRLGKMHDARITPTVVALFKRALELRARQGDREELHAVERDVNRALSIQLWETSIFDFDDIFNRDAPPAYMLERGPADDWHRALALRQQLEAALKQASAAA